MARYKAAREFPLFEVLLKYPWACALAFSPAVISVAVGCWLFRPTGAMLLALIIAVFLCLHVVEDYFSGTVTANVTIKVRTENPVGFWTLWTVWVLVYFLAASFPILFALQGRGEKRVSAPAREAFAKP